MLRRRLTSETQPRTKNGHPPHSTTGDASASWTHMIVLIPSASCTGCPGISSDIASANTGSVSMSPTMNRRVMSRSSVLSSGSPVMVRGSSAIPQIGHEPGWGRMISGCIGHVYSTPFVGFGGSTGAGGGATYAAGLAVNFSRHFGLQNQ